jgi:serine/threonine protein kinase
VKGEIRKYDSCPPRALLPLTCSQVIFDVLGTPKDEEIARVRKIWASVWSRAWRAFRGTLAPNIPCSPTTPPALQVRTDAARDYLRSVHPKAPEDLNKRFPTAGRDATDLLLRLLAFLPEDRLTIDGALAHPFLAPVRRPHDEVGRAEGPVHFHRVGADNIRERMVEEIRAYNAHIPDNWQELAAAGLYQGYSAGTFVKEGDGEDLSATGEGST